MKKSNKKMNNQEKGITLIALVVTIVVLLILTSVSISMLTGENGIIKQASEARIEEEKATDKENIQLAITEIISENNGPVDKDKLQEKIKNNISNKTIEVSNKRPEEYQYIVTVGERIYGITEKNEVVALEPEIRDQYIEITEVEEATPKYTFKNTITQKDVDKEANKSNATYQIIGVSNEENGEYLTSGTIEGKSGFLTIIDLQKAEFEYTLNKFMQGDEIFYVKVKIGEDLEKIQKLNIIQGDVVRYEECFAGIEYTGNWVDVEEDILSGGKAKYSTTRGDIITINCKLSGLDVQTIADTNIVTNLLQVKKPDETGNFKIIKLATVTWNWPTRRIIKLSEAKNRPLYFDESVSGAKVILKNTTNESSGAGFYFDMIEIYK